MTLRKFITGILSVLVIAGVMAPSLMAQSLISGDLTGTVTDPSGAVVPGATVTLKSEATGASRTTTSAANGTYRFSLLGPGMYTITVTAQGFSKAEAKANVAVGQATIADVTMTLGGATQTVEVTTAAPLVQADNADLSTNFGQSLLNNQPNGGNDITYVAQTAPGVTMNVGQGYGNFSSYGLPATSNLFTVNGENDMDPYMNLNNSGATNLTLGKNEMQEATVISNAYSGQYGQQAGAQVNYVTKSGTNLYHGNAEYWWTGRAMNANDWFNKFSDPVVPRPFANNNQWAASFGGPIKKDKLFFFVNNEGIRYIVPTATPVYAPTPEFANATLVNLAATDPGAYNSGLYQKYFNLFQSAPGYNPSNLITNSCGDLGPGDPNLYYNIPGLTPNNCLAQYQANPALPGTEWILSGRIDYNVSDNDHLYWRVRMDHGTQATYADPINNAFSAASYQPSYDGQGQWNHVFSSNATNQFIYAGSYYRAIFTQNNPSLFPYSLFGYGMDLTAVGADVYGYPQGRNVTQYQFVDDFSWTKGAHALKFGANFRRYDISDYAFSQFNYPAIYIASIDDLFFDDVYMYRQRFPSNAVEPIAMWGLGVYGQDEWKVNRSLKLTLAVRFEHNSNPVCQTNCSSLLNSNFYTLANTGVLGDPATPYNTIVDAYRHQVFNATDAINVSPRFGFAWSPGGSDKTVVRGGFGIFYDALPGIMGDNMMTNLPNEVEERLGWAVGSSAPWANPSTYALASECAGLIQTGFTNGASWSTVGQLPDGTPCRRPTYYTQAGTFHTPYYEQWSVGIQQAIGEKSSVSLGYVGNHGVHIPIFNEGVNAYDPAGYFSGALPDTQTARMFNVVEQYTSSGISNYNGVTASFNQRLTYGFTVQASYTWSHTMDEVSNGGSTLLYNGVSSFQYQINPNCLRCNNYGNADYDIRNYFSASYVWQEPFKFNNKFVNGAFGGWTLSQNFFARTGLPYTIVDGGTSIPGYAPTYTVAQINSYVNNPCTNGWSQCVPAANVDYVNGTINPIYSSPGITGAPLSGFPNQRRNMYRGPGFFDSDFTVNKNFKLTERVAFGIGANFYNIFNHPNFTNPDSTIGDSTFGQITTTTAPPTGPYGAFLPGLPSGRIIQFQGKIVF